MCTQAQAKQLLQEHIETAQSMLSLMQPLTNIAQIIIKKLQAGGKIFFCGNGGSAADAQHLAAELIGRFYKERKAIPALALTTDTSILTCLSNDYSYDIVFSRQLEAFCSSQDVVILLTTSGNSLNLIKAAEIAKKQGAYCAAFTGFDGGKLKNYADDTLIIPSKNVPRIQEMQIFLGHTLCEWIEEALS